MNAQAAVDAGRIEYERQMFSPDTLALLRGMGHKLASRPRQGVAGVIAVHSKTGRLDGGADPRDADSAAMGY